MDFTLVRYRDCRLDVGRGPHKRHFKSYRDSLTLGAQETGFRFFFPQKKHHVAGNVLRQGDLAS